MAGRGISKFKIRSVNNNIIILVCTLSQAMETLVNAEFHGNPSSAYVVTVVVVC